jgi:hypothetical protein
LISGVRYRYKTKQRFCACGKYNTLLKEGSQNPGYFREEVYENVLGRDILKKDVTLGYISWQDLSLQFKKLYLENPYRQVIVQDIIAHLTRKGLEDFTSMSMDNSRPHKWIGTFHFLFGKQSYI